MQDQVAATGAHAGQVVGSGTAASISSLASGFGGGRYACVVHVEWAEPEDVHRRQLVHPAAVVALVVVVGGAAGSSLELSRFGVGEAPLGRMSTSENKPALRWQLGVT